MTGAAAPVAIRGEGDVGRGRRSGRVVNAANGL